MRVSLSHICNMTTVKLISNKWCHYEFVTLSHHRDYWRVFVNAALNPWTT